MQFEHGHMRLWVEPNENLARGTIEPGSDVNLMVGVEPADASNQVQLRYRVNGGHTANIAAEPVRHAGNTQYFKACLPCSTLRDGDLVEYAAVCQCAGRQVPSAHEAEQFSSSFRVMSTSAMGAQIPTSNYTKNMKSASVASSPAGTRIQTNVGAANQLKQTHLSLFAVDQKTGHPIARIPFYAEVSVIAYVPLPKPECRLKETIEDSYKKFLYRSSTNPGRYSRDLQVQVPDAFTEPLCDALSSLLSPETIDALVGDSNKVADLITGIFTKAKEINKNNEISSNDPEASRKLLEAAIRAYIKEHDDLHLVDQNAQLQKIVWAHPLGALATDHAGYLSFDLTRLPPDVASAVASALEARRRNPNIPTETSIRLYPMAQEEKRIDALEQMRFAHDAIVVRIELDLELDPVFCQPKMCESVKNLGIAAMQNPSLTDWRLSPASFATNPSTLLGEDGCESLLPANIALQEFYFYQIVGLSDIHPNDLPPETQGKVKFGVAHEYRLAWYPLGHSLGQIQYSLPLAPGESVNLAVIDWTRRDVGSRTEDSTASEQLVHNQRRDRTITETVNAAIKEYQKGSSFMGGIAHSGGISGTFGMFGIAAGTAASLGGSSSNSQGSRDIAANTVQKLSDNITQSSASMRELQSTVVVQTMQHEKETIETRTVVNYNHSHALTILYYEVLRHFRVVTEYVRSRPIVLVKLDTNLLTEENLAFVPRQPSAGSTDPAVYIEYTTKLFQHILTTQNLVENRSALEAALLDKRHNEGFNALQRAAHRRNIASATPPPPASDPPFNPADSLIRFFNIDIKTGGLVVERSEGEGNRANVNVKLNPTGYRLNDGNPINLWGSFTQENANNSFTAWLPADVGTIPNKGTIRWGDIDSIEFNVSMSEDPEDWSDISFQHIKVTGKDINGEDIDLIDKHYIDGHLILQRNGAFILPTRRPPLLPPSPPPPQQPIEEIEDNAKINELIDHLRYHRAHYSRALYLNQNTAERARQLNEIKLLHDATLLEKVENRPLEMLGDFVAYPCANSDWAIIIKDTINKSPLLDDQKLDERLITLPTRGIFAEAKLGHCNASEEIDPNRFWKWEEHPIPHLAPEIAAIQAGQHTVKDLDLKSTPFPQPLVNIVNPPAAPDPTGLAAALNVLGTPNIFRDMSGRTEVADLLKKLSDNSISIADAANKAKEIQNKHGVDLDKQQKGYDLGKYQTATDLVGKAIDAESKRLENENKKLDIANKLPPAERKEVQNEVARELKKPTSSGDSLKKPAASQTPSRKSKENIKLQIDLKGYGNNLLIGRFGVRVKQGIRDVGFLMATDYSKEGQLVVGVLNENNDPRYSVEINGEILGGVGINTQLLGRDLVTIPREDFDAYDYFYLVATAEVDDFEFEATNSDEIAHEVTKRIGGGIDVAAGQKATITAKTEGGVEWMDGKTHTSTKAVKLRIVYYKGSFNIHYYGKGKEKD